MLDVVAPHKHELPLTVQTERVDQPEPRLARSASRHIQPVGENEPVKERQPHQDGDPAGRQNSDLDDPVVAERKVTQPLHAESSRSRRRPRKPKLTLWRVRIPHRTVSPERVVSCHGPRGRAPPEGSAQRPPRLRMEPGSNITKHEVDENCGFRPASARSAAARAKTSIRARGSKIAIVGTDSARAGAACPWGQAWP